jgi:methionine biosynthesis protein MetW
MNRSDLAIIAGWLSQGDRVLDLGCGDGELLASLADARSVRGYGIDIADDNVLACVRRGVNVIQSDLESGLAGFADHSFDTVILSQTLQQIHRVEIIINEMLRVGREVIVTFPNFAYWRHRVQLGVRGTMPVSRTLPYEWYNTPNVRMFTVREFDRFCRDRGIAVIDREVQSDEHRVTFAPNLFGQVAFYRIRKG